jgi:streptogramin lyase
VAWTKGTFDEATCRWDDTKVWTECWNWPTAEVLLLDGETGVIEQSVPIPGANQRIYGGAVDGEGNFWGNQDTTALVRVDREDFSVQTWGVPEGLPSYGIAIDLEGRPWLCGGGGAARFDIETETFQALPSSGFSQIGGCMVDANGILWHGRFHEAVLLGIDTETVEFVSEFAIPAYVHGVSIDFAGNVWGVGFGSTEAYRVDPVTGQVDTFAGLVGAYSYSDMTGFALSSAGTPAG